MTGLAVTGIGMATSLGLDTVDSCAGARAGLARLTEITTLNAAVEPALAKEDLDGVPPFVGHVVPVVGAGSCGLAKLLALARPALLDLLNRAGLDDRKLARTGLCINLSDTYFQNNFGVPADPIDEQEPPDYRQQWTDTMSAFPRRLCAAVGLAIPHQAQVVVAGGHVGLVDALQQAQALLHRGIVDRCIVGGVESCVEPDAIQAYAAAGVVKSAANPAGFLPGEGAAFLLVEASRVGSGETFRIDGIGESSDVPYLDPGGVPCGQGLADAVAKALDGSGTSGERMPRLVLVDLNGNEGRAADWGHALVRLRAAFGDVPFDVWLPALSFGETGAAAGALAICLAVRAHQRGYAPGPGALVVLASEDGRRGAVLLGASQQ